MPGQENPPRILIVEDDATISYILQRSLEGMGCHVTFCTNGLEAASQGLPGSFDLALLDHFLPGLLGSEVLAEWQRAGIDFPVMWSRRWTRKGPWLDLSGEWLTSYASPSAPPSCSPGCVGIWMHAVTWLAWRDLVN